MSGVLGEKYLESDDVLTGVTGETSICFFFLKKSKNPFFGKSIVNTESIVEISLVLTVDTVETSSVFTSGFRNNPKNPLSCKSSVRTGDIVDFSYSLDVLENKLY